MTLMDQAPVMDILPWPQGRGFAGASAWWEHVLSKDERQRLDHLMGVALLDEDVCRRLLQEQDDSLLSAFGLSEETRARLRAIDATSLTELAQAIISGPQNGNGHKNGNGHRNGNGSSG